MPPETPPSESEPPKRGSVRPPRSIPPRPGGPEALVGMMLSGRYKIERVIGEGGMGAVYQAEHTLMHKRFAVKVLHPDMSRMPEVVARFEREAMAAAHIDHPNVATATDFGKLDDGSFFLVLEYIEGKSLRDLVALGPLDPSRALRITRQIASALGRAHALGIVHRDLKPENVMLVERDGDPDFVKVLDFGIAKVPMAELAPESNLPQGKVLTQLGMVYGTPEYMAPEQALGQEVDARADLYSLGVMTYEMLTGSRPFDNESKVKLLGMQVTAPVPPMPGAPPEAEAIVTRLLKKEAGERFADAKEVVDVIDQAFGAPASQTALPPSSLRSLPSLPDASGQTAALAPTALHASRPQPQAHASPLANLPIPMKLIAASLSGLGVLALIVFVLLRNASHGQQTTMSDGGFAVVNAPSSSGAPHVDDASSEQVRQATAKLATGDADGAIALLTKVEADHPERSDVHKQLYLAYMQTSSTKAAMDEAGRWLDTDEKAQNDVKLATDVKAAALSGKDGADGAFAILEGKLGASGPDMLYDLGFGTGVGATTSLRARKSLSKPEVQKITSPALEVTLAIRKAETCEQKHTHFDRAREVGDQRTLVVLMSYTPKTGCGFVGTRDCWPCMHKDGSLLKTITALQARTP